MYVFNDNYGTSEEKLFLKHFKSVIEPKLIEKDLEYYIIRNERVPELAIYSFDDGERFEPDFLLFLRKKGFDKTLNLQGYIEPKGSHLLDQDSWKESFLKEIKNSYNIKGFLADNHKILGLPFFNKENRLDEFDYAIKKVIDEI